MTKKTFKEVLTRHADKQDLKDLIKIAQREIKEWQEFMETCKSKLKEIK